MCAMCVKMQTNSCLQFCRFFAARRNLVTVSQIFIYGGSRGPKTRCPKDTQECVYEEKKHLEYKINVTEVASQLTMGADANKSKDVIQFNYRAGAIRAVIGNP